MPRKCTGPQTRRRYCRADREEREDGNLVAGIADEAGAVKWVTAIQGDRLWVGTFDHGLAVLDHGGWTRITDRAIDPRINALLVDRRQRLWVATSAGIGRLTYQPWAVSQPRSTSCCQASAVSTPSATACRPRACARSTMEWPGRLATSATSTAARPRYACGHCSHGSKRNCGVRPPPFIRLRVINLATCASTSAGPRSPKRATRWSCQRASSSC